MADSDEVFDPFKPKTMVFVLADDTRITLSHCHDRLVLEVPEDEGYSLTAHEGYKTVTVERGTS